MRMATACAPARPMFATHMRSNIDIRTRPHARTRARAHTHTCAHAHTCALTHILTTTCVQQPHPSPPSESQGVPAPIRSPPRFSRVKTTTTTSSSSSFLAKAWLACGLGFGLVGVRLRSWSSGLQILGPQPWQQLLWP